jgi:hypothetical protein
MASTSTDRNEGSKKPNGAKPPEVDERMEQAERAFSDLKSIAISPQDLIGGQRIRSVIPVRRPKSNEFVRAHPDPDHYAITLFLYDVEGDATYYVQREMVNFFTNGVVAKLITVAVNQWGNAFLWPVPNSDAKTMRNAFNCSHRRAYHESKTKWIKMFREDGADLYTIVEAIGKLPEPEWPNEPFDQLLEIGFRGKVVNRPDHDVILGQAGKEVS